MNRTRASPSTSPARNSMNQADASAMIAGWVLPFEILIFIVSWRFGLLEDFGNARRHGQDIFWRFHAIRPTHLQPPALNNRRHGAKRARLPPASATATACVPVHRAAEPERPGRTGHRSRGFEARKKLRRRPPTRARSSAARHVDESHGWQW